MDINLREFKIICGAMSWLSNPNLVAAVSNAKLPTYNMSDNKWGARALGVLASGAMDAEKLNLAIKEIKIKTDAPYAINLISMNPHYEELVNVCADHKVPIVIIAAGMPSAQKIERIKQFGAKVIAFANSLILAQDLIKKGIDGIILEGSESGGHVGSIAISVLIQEILFEIADKIPVIVAGGIGRGDIIKHYFNMGASAVQLGTRFVCARESPMHPSTKNFYIKKKAKDTVVVSSIDPALYVIPVRVINNQAVEKFYEKQREAIAKLRSKEFDNIGAQLHIEHFWSGSLYKGVIKGDLEYGSLMAGQSLSFVEKEETVQEIIENLYNQMS